MDQHVLLVTILMRKKIPTRSYGFPAPDPGSGSAGQCGDTQGLSDIAEADSESGAGRGRENFEAEVVMGIENAPDADVSEVRTKQIREDDIPPQAENE